MLLTKSNILISLSLLLSFCLSAESLIDVKQCLKHENDKDRLACYDAIANKVDTEAVLKQAKKLEASAKNKNELFGLEHKKYLTEDSADKIEAKVVKAKKNPYGYIKLTLDNGQVWQQTAGRRFKVKTDDMVRIERSLLGSFKIYKSGSDTGFKFKRLK